MKARLLPVVGGYGLPIPLNSVNPIRVLYYKLQYYLIIFDQSVDANTQELKIYKYIERTVDIP